MPATDPAGAGGTTLPERIEARAVPLTRGIALAGLLCFVAVALVTIVDVLMRWLFNSPIDGVEEISRLVVAIAIASFFPSALVERHHIAITFVGSAAGPRINAWLEAFAAVVTSLFFLVLGWEFIHYTGQLVDAGETTWILGWPVAPWWAVTTLFMLICVPVQLVVLAVEMARAAGASPRPPGDELPERVSPTDGEY